MPQLLASYHISSTLVSIYHFEDLAWPEKALSELAEGRPVLDSFDLEISEISILSKLRKESSRLFGLLDSLSRTESGGLTKRGSSPRVANPTSRDSAFRELGLLDN